MKSIEVICGPMYSGKTEELIRRLRRADIANQKVMVFKPEIDNRYSGKEQLVSHNGLTYKCCTVASPAQIRRMLRYMDENPEVIGIEEAQFFDHEEFRKLLEFLEYYPAKRLIITGLDMDYTGKPFENITYSMGIAEKVQKLNAVCTVCGEDATRTQKLGSDEGKERIQVGGAELYEARCRTHWSKTGDINV